MYFSFFTFFSVSSHILGPTVCVSHFERFSLFLAIFQVLPSEFLIFLLCKCFFFSPYSRSYSVFDSFFMFLSFLPIIQVLQCVCLIFHVFQFSRHDPGPTVCISHVSRFSVFLAIFQVKQCLCLIFHFFQFSRHSPGLLYVFLIFHVFQCF